MATDTHRYLPDRPATYSNEREVGRTVTYAWVTILSTRNRFALRLVRNMFSPSSVSPYRKSNASLVRNGNVAERSRKILGCSQRGARSIDPLLLALPATFSGRDVPPRSARRIARSRPVCKIPISRRDGALRRVPGHRVARTLPRDAERDLAGAWRKSREGKVCILKIEANGSETCATNRRATLIGLN
ncbi:unnamed protein product [Xylocopa violacea]|uniref:Uncharacterized protein n=1 Tax=Xylocopa violacea TaxID=135666 RepID=A0ABP1MXT7_XYLVO